MLRYVAPLKEEANDRGVKLEPDDLDVLYERSVIHAEHGSVKKVQFRGAQVDCRLWMGF
jgi:hypothetical protein